MIDWYIDLAVSCHRFLFNGEHGNLIFNVGATFAVIVSVFIASIYNEGDGPFENALIGSIVGMFIGGFGSLILFLFFGTLFWVVLPFVAVGLLVYLIKKAPHIKKDFLTAKKKKQQKRYDQLLKIVREEQEALEKFRNE